MALQIFVPPLGESVSEAIIAKWYKSAGDTVEVDERLADLETDKVTLEVNAPAAGTLTDIRFKEGDKVVIGDILGLVEEGQANTEQNGTEKSLDLGFNGAPSGDALTSSSSAPDAFSEERVISPAAQKHVMEQNVDISGIQGSAKDGKVITKSDVLQAEQAPMSNPVDPDPFSLGAKKDSSQPPLGGIAENIAQQQTTNSSPLASVPATDVSSELETASNNSQERRVKMTKLRQTIAKRLKESQNTAAILSTFNEIDMSAIFAIRKRYQENFKKKYDVKLGFMSFFIKAAIIALHDHPDVNAEIDGEEIIYKDYYNIGIAVGTEQGLVVPIVRNADSMSFAEIEQEVVNLGNKAREGKLSISDMNGGSFTITNGGIYGSLLSTPIINPPQSGILGMHNIVERPVVVNGEIVARPMMYVALSYDHRIVDGKGAVTFLVRMKELCENPERLLFDI